MPPPIYFRTPGPCPVVMVHGPGSKLLGSAYNTIPSNTISLHSAHQGRLQGDIIATCSTILAQKVTCWRNTQVGGRCPYGLPCHTILPVHAALDTTTHAITCLTNWAMAPAILGTGWRRVKYPYPTHAKKGDGGVPQFWWHIHQLSI